MAITYANYFHGYNYTRDAPFGDHHVLLYDIVVERTGYNLLDRLRAVDPTLRNASCVVLRGRTPSFLATLQDDRLLWAALRNTPTIALVGGLDRGQIKLIDTPPFRHPDFEIPIEVLRNHEIRSIIERNGALYGPHDGYHYELPSGDHADAFLRLGNALQEPIEVTRICDWILPLLGPNVGIVVDTGGLLPLMWCACYEAKRLYGWDIPTRVIASYPVEPAAIQSVVNDLFRELGPDGKILFLVSVSSSGRLIQRMLNLLLPMSHTLLVVCDTVDPPLSNALVNLPIQRWGVDVNGKCETCDTKKIFFIDRHTYERVLSLERVSVTIKREAASAHHDFWEAVDRTNAVHLHHDLILEDGTQRHYGIYIDLVALTGDQWFRKNILSALQNIGRPSIALVPKHRASEALREILLEAFNALEVLFVAPGQFTEEVTARLRCLGEKDTVLVVDDGLVSSTTLNNFRPLIHKVYKELDAMPVIKAFVVLARPSRQAALRDIRNRYRDSGAAQFSFAYQIFLPDYRECPWCRERMHLEGAFQKLQGSGRACAARRIEQLSGALQIPFLLGGQSTDANARSVGSFFGKLKQSAAFAAATSSIYEQWITETGDQDDAGAATKTHYVDVPRLLNNYFADAFSPAVLRTMKPKHLTYVAQNQAIMDAIDTVDPQRAFPCFVPELLWAAVEGKLPSLAAQKLLGKIHDKTPEIQMLEQLMPHT